jgi:hypothetical protein
MNSLPPIEPPINTHLREVADRVAATISDPSKGTEQFEQLALEVFRAQYADNALYRRWCQMDWDRTGLTPSEVERWQQIPALPISAFKQMRVACHPPSEDVAVWRSSGTTRRTTSQHHLPDLLLYELSLDAGIGVALFPDLGPPQLGLASAAHAHDSDMRTTVVQLAPSARLAPNSSLVHMFDRIRTYWGTDGGSYANERFEIDVASAIDALRTNAESSTPVTLIGTTFAVVELIDALAESNSIALPPGSRLLDTGGTKGRVREIEREALLTLVAARLGIPPEWCENEYGMSELSSQAWLGTIAQSCGARLVADTSGGRTAGTRWQPWWFRTRVVHPTTLESVSDGELGLLVHYDLANVWSCAAIRSEDVGIRRGNSYELVGRAPGAGLRGCSLSVEDATA